MTSKLTNTLKKTSNMTLRPVVTYACRTWTLSVWDINNLLVFERQILRKIFGSIQCKEELGIKSNKGLHK
jgi:hypothetical protein